MKYKWNEDKNKLNQEKLGILTSMRLDNDIIIFFKKMQVKKR
jgi:uncharacterized DUF497 family protein